MPVIKHADQRVGVFIDTQNLYHSAKNIHGAKVDFGAVLAKAVSGRVLVRAIAYVVSTEGGDERAFFDALQHIGIETKSKELQIFAGGTKKGDWDVGLAIDAITLSEKLDTVILATADGDFVPLVEYLRSHGCQVEVLAFGRSTSGKLKEAADEFIDMDLEAEQFLIPGYKRPQSRPLSSDRIADLLTIDESLDIDSEKDSNESDTPRRGRPAGSKNNKR